jgi:uncharacterized membrane protein YeaQ/YmgE (transglycosylase-associated protein family)
MQPNRPYRVKLYAMSFLWWLLIGLAAGAIAKALMPGDKKEPKGCLYTMGLGVAGSILVGFSMNLLGLERSGGTISTLIGATIGACALIFLFRKFWR